MNFDKEQFKAAVQRRLTRDFSKDIEQNDTHDIYDAVAASVLAEVMKNWMKTRSRHDENRVKKVSFGGISYGTRPRQQYNQFAHKRGSLGGFERSGH